MMLDDYTVPSKELRVSVGMRFEGDNLGAQTSGTESSHKGIKPKTITVSLLIPFVDKVDLSELTAIAEAIQEDGSLHIYDVTEDAANAMKVRQVQFTDSFDVRTDWRLNAWQVNFSLQEYKSVPEKVEQRQNKVTAVVQQATGQTIGAPVGEAEQAPQQGMSTMESIVAKLDGLLAPTPSPTNETT